MPNIYYCNTVPPKISILRAVLSWEEGKNLLKLLSVRYVGMLFPKMAEGQAADFAVLRVFDKEPVDPWQAGFYTLDGDLARIEDAVQACTSLRSSAPPFKEIG
jgi:hypothetical protein